MLDTEAYSPDSDSKQPTIAEPLNTINRLPLELRWMEEGSREA